MKCLVNKEKLKKSKFKSCRGSVSVFLAIAMTALFAVTLSMVYSAHEKNIESCSDSVLRLAGDSLLSEYNYYIYQDYGLFLVKGTDQELTAKFRNYASYSLNPVIRGAGGSFESVYASSDRFNINDPSAVHDQIIALMKTTGIPSAVKNGIDHANGSDAGSHSFDENTLPDRTLRHGPTIDSLPSPQLPDKSIITSAGGFARSMSDPKAAFSEGTETYLFDSYIISKFNSDTNSVSSEHFFRNEVEYILCGKLSDRQNRIYTDLALEALRTPSNLSAIYADPEKRTAIAAAAEVITPGALGTVTQAGISLAWAAAESVNDVRLLHRGYPVPLKKDAASWATDLDGVIDGLGDNVIKPDVFKGRKYNDYLRILLFIKDNNIKTSRILDLIQINMRMNYDRDFFIQEYSTGVSFSADINGKDFIYDKQYK